MTKAGNLKAKNLAEIIDVLAGRVPEEYYLQRYSMFWEFIAFLCHPDEPDIGDDFAACAVANIVRNIFEGGLPSKTVRMTT